MNFKRFAKAMEVVSQLSRDEGWIFSFGNGRKITVITGSYDEHQFSGYEALFEFLEV